MTKKSPERHANATRRPLVSVVIPCYNLGAYIREAIESVLEQTFQDFEIIVIDDGSDDPETIKVLDELYHPKLSMIRTKNQGVCIARNTAISAASGRYICCLDPDDKIHPLYLEKTVNVLEKDTEGKLGFVTTWVQLCGERNEVWETLDYDPQQLAFANTVHVASLFRKEAWRRAGGYDAELLGYEDWALWIAIVHNGYEWKLLPEILFYYRVRPHSRVSTSHKIHADIYEQIVSKNLPFFKKHTEYLLARNTRELLNKEENIVHLGNLVKLNEKLLRERDGKNTIELAERNKCIDDLRELTKRLYAELSKFRELSQQHELELQRIKSTYIWKVAAYGLKPARELRKLCSRLLRLTAG